MLSVAQWIKEIQKDKAQIHGIFLLPDIVKMYARPTAHQKIMGNAYGSLIGLNYWQTPENMREYSIDTFMKKGIETITGNDPPFQIADLIGRENREGRGLGMKKNISKWLPMDFQ